MWASESDVIIKQEQDMTDLQDRQDACSSDDRSASPCQQLHPGTGAPYSSLDFGLTVTLTPTASESGGGGGASV